MKRKTFLGIVCGALGIIPGCSIFNPGVAYYMAPIPDVAVSGQVTDSGTGGAIADLRTVLLGPSLSYTNTTDSGGRYTFDIYAADFGAYTLKIMGPAGETNTYSLSVSEFPYSTNINAEF